MSEAKSFKSLQEKMTAKEDFSENKNKRRHFDDLKDLLEDMYSKRGAGLSTDTQITLEFKSARPGSLNCPSHDAATQGGTYYPGDFYKAEGNVQYSQMDALFTAPYPGPSWPAINNNTGQPDDASYNDITGSYCPSHSSSSFVSPKTFNSVNDQIDNNLKQCNCNSRTHNDSLCTSRTQRLTCACQSRTQYLCSCQSQNTCRNRSSNCGCHSRSSCPCNIYNGGWYNNMEVCACNSQGPSVNSCYCNTRFACKQVKDFIDP